MDLTFIAMIKEEFDLIYFATSSQFPAFI